MESIKYRPSNLCVILFCVILYLFNENYLKPNTDGVINFFSVCYFNDLLSPLLFLSYVNMVLLTNGWEIKKLTYILLICLLAGLLWEYGALFLKDGSVADVYDLCMYFVGGVFYWKINAVFSAKRTKRR